MVDAMAAASDRRVGAPNWFEACLVCEGRLQGDAAERLDQIRLELRVDIIPFGADAADLARQAFRRFGKRQHPADLNFGDCMAYALAGHTGQPLLFKGNDFAQTDIEAVPY